LEKNPVDGLLDQLMSADRVCVKKTCSHY
jgi:hypothetical protein